MPLTHFERMLEKSKDGNVIESVLGAGIWRAKLGMNAITVANTFADPNPAVLACVEKLIYKPF
jgi:hypothetical protein